MACTSSRLVLKWESRPPFETPAAAATASSVSACAPSRLTTTAAASSRRSLVRAGGIEPDHAEHDKAERGELEHGRGLLVERDADKRDRGGPDGRPDGVRRADAQVLEHMGEKGEGD